MYKYVIVVVIGLIITGCHHKSEKPEDVYPCWTQSWKDGDWTDLHDLPASSTFSVTGPVKEIEYPVAEKEAFDEFGVSLCFETMDIRILNLSEKKQRVIQCEWVGHGHDVQEWHPTLSLHSANMIKSGDCLFIVYQSRLYAVWVNRIFADHEALVQFCEFQNPRLPVVIVGKDIVWKSEKLVQKIVIGDRYIEFKTVPNPKPSDNSEEQRFCMVIFYDRGYGSTYPGLYPGHFSAAHIAIVDREEFDLMNINLKNYRFKTWEDGLGNRCQ